MAPQNRIRRAFYKAPLLLLGFCLLPKGLAIPTSTMDESVLLGDICSGQPYIKNMCESHPCLVTKTVSIDSRKQEPPCPGNNCDPRDQGGPFSPPAADSAAAHSVSNPLHYPVLLAHFLMSTARATVEVQPRRHQPTVCPGAYCITSTTSSIPTPSPSNPAAGRSITNPLRYPVFVIHYLVSAARAGLTRARLETGGQDEEADINDIAHCRRNRFRSSSAAAQAAFADRSPAFYSKATPFQSSRFDLKRHEYESEARDPRIEPQLNCWVRDENSLVLCACDKCPLDARLKFPTLVSAASPCSLPFLLQNLLSFFLQWRTLDFLAAREKDGVFVEATTKSISSTTTPAPAPAFHAQTARNLIPVAATSAASRSHSLPLRNALGLLLRWPNLVLSCLHTHAVLAQGRTDTIHLPSITTPSSLHLAAPQIPQGSIPAPIADLPQSCTEIYSSGVTVQLKCCWSPDAASALANNVPVCPSASSNRLNSPVRWLRQLMAAMKLGVLDTEMGSPTRKQVDLNLSPLETPTMVKVQHHRNGDESLTLNLDLHLTDGGCGKNETSEEGKNARESLGLGSALVAMWGKARTTFQAANSWPRLGEDSRMARICGWLYKGGKWVEVCHGDRMCAGQRKLVPAGKR